MSKLTLWRRPFLALLCGLAVSLSLSAQGFVKVRGTHFYKQGTTVPYHFMGTNLWYAPILGSVGEGGNRTRLCAELDSLRALGVSNLRILVGADGGSKHVQSVVPCLQPEPGVLNDTLLAGLDFTLVEMAKRHMVAVIYLTNSWDWSGGYGFYLRATGHGDSPDASGEGYSAYVDYAADFFRDAAARALYADFVERVVTRTNSLTGRPYRDDPTIMAWQLCNEPRPFHRDCAETFVAWVRETARRIKRLDPNHLVSTGSEGTVGCLLDEQICRRVHAIPEIDYLTVHIWPVNWGWAKRGSLFDCLPRVYERTEEYIALHDRMARQLDKPFVVEEFGYPRDGNFFRPETTTQARDAFYSFVFSLWAQSVAEGGPFAGCNFWGWGGAGRAQDETWQPGDDYLCDPPHEPQGWYSVFNSDASTLRVIREASGLGG